MDSPSSELPKSFVKLKKNIFGDRENYSKGFRISKEDCVGIFENLKRRFSFDSIWINYCFVF
jgi:hypothetical protein